MRLPLQISFRNMHHSEAVERAIVDRADGDLVPEKVAIVRRLARASLPDARAVLAFHEALRRPVCRRR